MEIFTMFISKLQFFSHNPQESQTLEGEVRELKARLRQCDNDTPESELGKLQKQLDAKQARADELRSIHLKPISVAAFKKLPYVDLEQTTNEQEFKQREALIFACADITTEQFSLLKSPDFLKLCEDIQSFILTPGDEVQGNKLDGSAYEFDLLHPFENETGETISHIKFTIPTVAHSRALSEIEEDAEQEDFMFRVVTGLEPADFEFLSLNDYVALKPQVASFFLQSAAFFRRPMLMH